VDPAPAVASLGVTEDQRQVAAKQFERAAEVLASASQDKGYAYDLLLTCCKLDPTNTTYRRRLRQAAVEVRQRQGLGKWMAPLTAFAAKARLRTAKHSGNYRKVLDCGEEVLARSPDDVATHLDMADAAEAMGLTGLHIWLLEQACKLALKDPEPLRRLATAYEKLKDLDKAIVVWQSLRKLWPHDSQAARKINALSIRETIIRGNYDDTT
jgi:tetratricopeptide (TPR) repeat protein